MPVWHIACYIHCRALTENQKRGEIQMAIQKKSLIGNMTFANKAIIATTPATPAPASTVKTAKMAKLAKLAKLAKMAKTAKTAKFAKK
jgi:hypothetical protein